MQNREGEALMASI